MSTVNPPPGDATRPWPDHFPHAEIDSLICQLKYDDGTGSTLNDNAVELLRMVAREAERLRSTVARLTMERLSEAEREAGRVVAQAHAHADTLLAGSEDTGQHPIPRPAIAARQAPATEGSHVSRLISDVFNYSGCESCGDAGATK